MLYVFVGLPALLMLALIVLKGYIAVRGYHRYRRMKRAFDAYERNGGQIRW